MPTQHVRGPSKRSPEDQRALDQIGLRIRELQTAIKRAEKRRVDTTALQADLAKEIASLPADAIRRKKS